jgi:hypothetical protein
MAASLSSFCNNLLYFFLHPALGLPLDFVDDESIKASYHIFGEGVARWVSDLPRFAYMEWLPSSSASSRVLDGMVPTSVVAL